MENIKLIREKGTNPYSSGNLVDALRSTKNYTYLGEPSHGYRVALSDEEAAKLGYERDADEHIDDRIKFKAHPSHPSRGAWKNGGYEFALSDYGFEDPNYTIIGLAEPGQDPLAVVTYKNAIVLPEITVTPNGNYYQDNYDNYRYFDYAHGGKVNKFLGGDKHFSLFLYHTTK